MTIGINATAALKQPRTGVEEYAHQLIKHLTMLPEAKEHRFILYAPKIGPNIRIYPNNDKIFDFPLPENFEIKILKWPFPVLWTQVRLAWEIFKRPPEVMFFPVHILPVICTKKAVVTLHGLEFEFFPKYYPFWKKFYFRRNAKFALKRARKIIAVSQSTKNDLIKLYGADPTKIKVVHHGINPPSPPFERGDGGLKKPYLFYLGRIEQKKNIDGILEAYKILKEKYSISHELVLAGSPGYGYKNLKLKIEHLFEIRNLEFRIKELGYISNEEKWRLLRSADIFLFPSFYEGFGLPVLEAQSLGIPVVTSFDSSLPEIAGEGALFVNPKKPAQIAEAVKKIIDDRNLRDRLVASGYENLKRFDWGKCASETLNVLLNQL